MTQLSLVSAPPETLERLTRYLPADLAARLSADPAALAEAGAHLAAAHATVATYLPQTLVSALEADAPAGPWLRRDTGSLLFADLSGSTALAERLAALGREGTELVTAILNELFTTLIATVQRFGGDLRTFGGDALLVSFQGPAHAASAARAGLALLAVMHNYTRVVPGAGSFPMHLHIGVASGTVIFASIGLPHARHACVLGPVVNAVAVAEGLAEAGELVVAQETWALLQADAPVGVPLADGYVRLEHLAEARVAPLPATPTSAEPPSLTALLDALDSLTPYIVPTLLGRILADPQRPVVEAELRPVTVLFAQVRGLDQLIMPLEDAQAAAAVQRYLTGAQQAVERYGGWVNKIDVADEGVKLVAIFGAPLAFEDHAERAGRAALEILQLAEHSSVRPQLRLGLNTGTAFAGNVGSPIRKEYTVMGDAVNTAARVMTRAAWGELWCSPVTAEVVSARLACVPRGAVQLKGKAEPLALFQITGERERQELSADDLPLIGRAAELARLRLRLAAAVAGNGSAVRVVGDAGLGKSRLVAELLRGVAERGVRVLRAACYSYTAGIPYAAWSEWLKSVCQIGSADSPPERIKKLSAALRAIESEPWLALLADLLRLDVPETELTRGLDPKLRQERTFDVLLALLDHAAAETPLVVVFEDLHWADPISLELWARATGLIGGRAALLLGVQRPAPIQDAAETLELRELPADQSDALIASIPGGLDLADDLRAQIAQRAAGNPLFLAELVRAVAVGGTLDALPESLNGLLLARIDRLDETSRGVLRVASVIGQRIPFGVLQAIQPADQQALVRDLSRLDGEDLTLLEREQPERVHAFRHALVQEVAYQSMLYARRRELHARIGCYLEERYADRLQDYYGLLAHHYRLSDQRDKAADYLIKAGRDAQAIYANEEAEQSYRWALEALDDLADPRSWEAADALADVLTTVGRYADAIALHAQVLEHSPVPDTRRRAHRKRGSVMEKQGRYTEALAELEQALRIARSGDPGIDRLAIPLVTADLGLVHQRRGEYDAAVAACEDGLRHLVHDLRTRDDELIEARLHSTLGAIYGMRGDYPRARHHFERSLRAREAIDDLPGIVVSNNNLGYLWQLQSEYERAIGHYRLAEETARRINLRYALIFSSLNTAYALISLGRYVQAATRCGDALLLAQALNDRQNIAQSHLTLGMVLHHMGDYPAAERALQEALRINLELESAYQAANCQIHIASVCSAQGRYAEAQQISTQALADAERLSAQRLKVEASCELAEAALGLGAAAAARVHAGQAAQLASEIGSAFDAGVAHRLLGCAVAMLGDQYSFDFQESIALLEQTNDRYELARTWAAYGEVLAADGNQVEARAYLKRAIATFKELGAAGELARLGPDPERSL